MTALNCTEALERADSLLSSLIGAKMTKKQLDRIEIHELNEHWLFMERMRRLINA